MSMRSGSGLVLRLLLSSAVSPGCGSEVGLDRPEVSSSAMPMINGQAPTQPHDDAVGALLLTDGAGGAMPFCSGTLVGPRVVLTAAHCIVGDFASTGIVFFGDALRSPLSSFGQIVAVAGAVVHPGYDAATTRNDIALVELASAPTGIAALPHLTLDLAMSASDTGATVRMLGFGLTNEAFAGGTAAMEEKLSASARVTQVCAQATDCSTVVGHAFSYDHTLGGPCSGDSGGPAFLRRGGREYVTGVNSTITAYQLPNGQADCMTASMGTETLVSDFAPFIEDFAKSRGLDLAANPCALETAGCAAEATCTRGHGMDFECLCPAGYSDPAGDGSQCTDLDECALGIATCTAAETCTNIPGAFTCAPVPEAPPPATPAAPPISAPPAAVDETVPGAGACYGTECLVMGGSSCAAAGASPYLALAGVWLLRLRRRD